MNNPQPRPPRNPNPDSLSRVLRRWMDKLISLIQQQEEQEKQRIANATFPWLALAMIFSCYFVTGVLLSLLLMPWAFISWVSVLGLSLLSLVIALNAAWMTEVWILDCIIDCLINPLRQTARALTDFFKRRIYRSGRASWILNLQLDCLPFACFLLLLLTEGMALGLGYQVGLLCKTAIANPT